MCLKHLEAILFPGLFWRYVQVQQVGSLNVDVCLKAYAPKSDLIVA